MGIHLSSKSPQKVRSKHELSSHDPKKELIFYLGQIVSRTLRQEFLHFNIKSLSSFQIRILEDKMRLYYDLMVEEKDAEAELKSLKKMYSFNHYLIQLQHHRIKHLASEIYETETEILELIHGYHLAKLARQNKKSK